MNSLLLRRLPCVFVGGPRTPAEVFAGGVAMLDLDVCRQIELFSVTVANDFLANQ